MFPVNCDAVLKNCKNQTLEIGTVTVSIKRRTADFVTAFVPLMKLGSEAKLICTHQNLATHAITGRVYLSSSRLLRLTDIQCTLLPNAEQALVVNAEFSAEVSVPLLKKGPLHRHLPHIWQDCLVLAVSLDGIALRCKRMPDDFSGQFRLRLGAPLFSAPTELTLVQSGRGILFGRLAKYEGVFEHITLQQAADISDYIRRMSIRQLGGTV